MDEMEIILADVSASLKEIARVLNVIAAIQKSNHNLTRFPA